MTIAATTGTDVSAIARLVPHLIHSEAVFASCYLCILQDFSPPVQSPTDSTTAPLPTDSPTTVIVVTSTPSPTNAVSTSPPTTAIPAPTLRPTFSVPATLTCPDTLDRSDYTVVLSDPAGSGNGLLCGRLEAKNDGWIGVGVSSDGSIAGSQEVIIGKPAQSTILKYNVSSYSSVTPG